MILKLVLPLAGQELLHQKRDQGSKMSKMYPLG